MTLITMPGPDLPFAESPVVWPNPIYGTLDNFAADVANAVERRYPEKFSSNRWGFRLMHQLAAMPWGELAGLYVWLREPLSPPGFVTVEEYVAVGETAQTWPILGHADEPGLGVEEAELSHPVLGQGKRYLRRVKKRRGLFSSSEGLEVRWVWRIEGHDLVITFARDDHAEAARVLPDVEALVASARLGRPFKDGWRRP